MKVDGMIMQNLNLPFPSPNSTESLSGVSIVMEPAKISNEYVEKFVRSICTAYKKNTNRDSRFILIGRRSIPRACFLEKVSYHVSWVLGERPRCFLRFWAM